MKYKYKTDNKGTRQKELDSIKNLYNMGRESKAMAEIERFIEKYPTDMYGHYLYATWLFNCKAYDNAKKEFEIVFAGNENNKYSSLVAIGEIEEFLGNDEKARECYERAINESPFFEKHAIMCLAYNERKNKNYERAIAVAQMLGPENQAGIIEIARNLTLLNRLEEAKKFLVHVTPTTEKEKREVALEKGKIAKIEEDYDLAMLYLKAAEGDGRKDRVYYSSIFEEAKVSLKKEQYNEAINMCEELIVADRTFNDEVYLLRGMGKQGIEDYKGAMNDYKISSNSPDDENAATANYYLGCLQLTLGDTKNAEISMKNSIDKSKDTYIARYIKLLIILLKENKLEEARSTIKKLRKKRPKLSKDKDIYRAKLLIDKRQGKELPPLNELGYIGRQIADYNIQSSLNYIKKEHTNPKNGKSVFNPELNIDDLYEEMKLHIIPENQIYKSILDTYCVDYPNSGYYNNEITNMVFIVTLPGTKDIISIYPSAKGKLPRRSEVEASLTKTETKENSRTSKFYKKYGMSQTKNAD